MATTIFSGVTATSSSTRFVQEWWKRRTRTAGQAIDAMRLDDWLIRPHTTYLALGTSAAAARMAYQAWVAQGQHVSECDEIRQHLQQQRALGTDRFRDQIATLTGRCVTVRSRGGQPRREPP